MTGVRIVRFSSIITLTRGGKFNGVHHSYTVGKNDLVGAISFKECFSTIVQIKLGHLL
jgi:hypothetical protein